MLRYICMIAALVLAPGTLAHAITLGQTNDFQDGTTQGWSGYATAGNVSTGGPAGVGDRYLLLTSSGSGLTSELRTFSGFVITPWGGDYVEAGVTAVAMDLLNLGAIDLEMRILVGGNFGDWTSDSAFTVPADGQWHRAVCGLTANELVWGGDQGGNSANLEDALRYCGGFDIRHQAGEPLGWRGSTPIASSLGIDNVTAVPEPVSGVLVAWAMLLLRRRT